MKSHYKLSSKPITAGSYVVIVNGFERGTVHYVNKRQNGIIWTYDTSCRAKIRCVFLERIAAWQRPVMLPLQELPQ